TPSLTRLMEPYRSQALLSALGALWAGRPRAALPDIPVGKTAYLSLSHSPSTKPFLPNPASWERLHRELAPQGSEQEGPGGEPVDIRSPSDSPAERCCCGASLLGSQGTCSGPAAG
ncbi:unnamed protein product, partial [Rangifer tarandus platyrhynchus]